MIKYTKLKTTNRQNLIEILPLQKPFTVLIEPSSFCNFRCIQCFQGIKENNSFTRNRMNMSLVRFRKIIGQLKDWDGPKIKVLKLSLYGEPLITPDFCEMLRIARDSDVAERIETTTNASLLSRKIAEKLVQYKLDYARVSIYATDQLKHQEITGSMIDVQTVHENLRVLQEVKNKYASERPFVGAKMLDTYGEDNQRFIEMYKDVADEVYIDKPHNWIKTGDSDFMKNYYQNGIDEAVNDFSEHSTRRATCPMAFSTMAIRGNGDVSPCCVDFIGGTNLGNIEQLSLKGIWYSDQWFEFQKMQLQNRKYENSSCARCDVYLSNHYTLDNIDGFPVEKLRQYSSERRGEKL